MFKNKALTIGYVLIFFYSLGFWYAPWLLFWLNYINFQQVAILQAVGIAVRVISELPTGALSDLIGKKKTLFIAFILLSAGEAISGFFPSFNIFLITMVLVSLGQSFYSGTMEAYMYDTLVQDGKEKEYPKVISRIYVVSNIALLIATISGGFMFSYLDRLPWIATAIGKLVGFIIVFWAIEPKVDTIKFTVKNFITQNRRGFQHLFSKPMIAMTLVLLTYGVFHASINELLDDASAITYGYTGEQLGILYAILIAIGIPFSFLYEYLAKKWGNFAIIAFGVVIIGIQYLLSPWLGVIFWTTLFVVRSIYSPAKDGAISDLLNTSTKSDMRATTISTYELVRKIPVMILTPFLGILVDQHGSKWVAFWIVIVMMLVLIPQIIYNSKKAKTVTAQN